MRLKLYRNGHLDERRFLSLLLRIHARIRHSEVQPHHIGLRLLCAGRLEADATAHAESWSALRQRTGACTVPIAYCIFVVERCSKRQRTLSQQCSADYQPAIRQQQYRTARRPFVGSQGNWQDSDSRRLWPLLWSPAERHCPEYL